MLIDFEDVGEFQYKRAGLVQFKTEAASEIVKARNWYSLVDLG